MKVKFLGTSAGWPLPRLGCECDICSSKDLRDKRSRSQLLVNDLLLLDIGPDTYFHLSREDVDPKKIKFAAITHEHSDHTFGLLDLGHIYNANKIQVLVGESTYKKIQKLFFYKAYQIIKVSDEKSIKVNGLEVSLLAVNHTDSSFGIFVKEEKTAKTLFYAPDFKLIPDATIKKVTGVDVAVLDGSELTISTPTHKPISENIELNKEIKAKNVYFTHLGHRTLIYKKLEQFVQKKGGKNFHVPYDGLEVVL